MGAAIGWGALAAGALTYFALDDLVERTGDAGSGGPLALGAFLDGIPEQTLGRAAAVPANANRRAERSDAGRTAEGVRRLRCETVIAAAQYLSRR